MPRTNRNRVAAAAASMAIVGGVFSLLIWGKLRLVGPVPRSAYAEPAPEAAGVHSSAASDTRAEQPDADPARTEASEPPQE